MRIDPRRAVFFLLILLAACGTDPPVSTPASALPPPAASVITRAGPMPAAAPAPSPTLDAYKTEVARQVMLRNPELVFEGVLPPLLPAIVVVNITVGHDGALADVQVQRSRDARASGIALASVRRSGRLPRPYGLAPPHGGPMTFSETFLFGERYRFQLRSLAGPQESGL